MLWVGSREESAQLVRQSYLLRDEGVDVGLKLVEARCVGGLELPQDLGQRVPAIRVL